MTKNKTFKTKSQAILYFICKDMLAELDEQEHLVPLEKEERLSKRIEHLLDKGFFINISESSDDKHLQTLNKYLTDYCEQNFKQKFEGVQYSWEEGLPAKKVTRKTISPFTFNNMAAVLDSCETCQPLIQKEIKNRRKPESKSEYWLLSDYSHSANNCKIIIAIFFLYLDKSITLSSLKQYQNKGKINWEVIQDLMATFLPKKDK